MTRTTPTLAALLVWGSLFNAGPLGPPLYDEPFVSDTYGRTLNGGEIILVDWEGYMANPTIRLYLAPPAGADFPADAVVSANGPRLYFDLPSTYGPTGPTKTLSFTGPDDLIPFDLSIFPDRDGDDEDYTLTIYYDLDKSPDQFAQLLVRVIDQDQPGSAGNFPVTVDFSKDQTGFFNNADRRDIVEQAADDWFYFFDGTGLTQVNAGAESTWIWNPDGYVDGSYATNTSAYIGFLLYAYGIHHDDLRSGGEGSFDGGFQSAAASRYPLRRSGGLSMETAGNYNELGWYLATGDDDWHHSGNFSDEQNDLYTIAHHEIAHALAFSPAYPRADDAVNSQLQDAPLLAYHGSHPDMTTSYHFDGSIDRLSQSGAVGWEYYGNIPRRRWLITKFDLLAAHAVGYKLRATSAFAPLEAAAPPVTFAELGSVYSHTVQATGGIPNYDFTVEGTLPPGLALNRFTGELSGDLESVGVYDFVVRVRHYDAQDPGLALALRIVVAESVHQLRLPLVIR